MSFDPTTFVVSLAGSVIVALVTTEYRIRRSKSVEQSQAEEDWYAEAANLGRQVRRQWERNYEGVEGSFTEYDEMRSKMNLLADQIDTHAGNASGMDVSEDIVDKLEETASACRRVHDARTSLGDIEDFTEAGEEAKNRANELEDSAMEEV